MFVSGTQDFPQDHWDDLKIPFNLTAESLRYRNADKALNNNELLNPDQQKQLHWWAIHLVVPLF
jgi:hypothetical protein